MFLVFELKLHAVHIFCIHVVFFKLPYLTVEKKVIALADLFLLNYKKNEQFI